MHSTRIRVLSLVGGLAYGGDENRILAMGKSLDKARFEHRVATIYRQDASFDEQYGSLWRDFAEAGIDVVELGEQHAHAKKFSARPDRIVHKTRVLVRVVRRLRRLMRQWRCDVLDAHLTAANIVGVIASRATKTPTAVTHYTPLNREPRLKRLILARTMRNADAVVTDSSVRRDEFVAVARGGTGRFVVIPNGVPAPVPSRSVAEVRSQFALGDGSRGPVIAQISRLYPFKGHRVLLAAATKVIAQYPQVTFLLVGFGGSDPTYRNELWSRAKELGIEKNVRIQGYPGWIGDVWSIVDIHVHASLDDSLPNAIIEGMSLGKPAVVTAVGGIPEMVSNEKTGLVVPPGDANALAEAIVRLIRHRDLAKKIGQGARQRYDERCRPDVVTRQHEKLFVELANVSKAGSRSRRANGQSTRPLAVNKTV